MTWPAYHYSRYKLARAIITAWEGYSAAKDTVAWTNEHPDQFHYIAVAEAEKARQLKAERETNGKPD